MLQELLTPLTKLIAHLLLLLFLQLLTFLANLPSLCIQRFLHVLTFQKGDRLELCLVINLVLAIYMYRRAATENKKLKARNGKLEAEQERNVARRTTKFNRTAPDTYVAGNVVQGIHIIGSHKWDLIINGMEIGGGHQDGRFWARVRGADEWIKYGSPLVINSNDVTEEVVEAGGNVDLRW